MTVLWTRRLWPYVAGLVVLLGAIWSIRAAWKAQFARGRASALSEAVTVAPAQRDTVRLAIERTDTVVRVVTRQAARVTDVAARVADTVRVAFPVVDTLVVESLALADSVGTLGVVVESERVAHQRLALSLSTITVAKSDTIRSLIKRPTRKRAAVIALVAIGTGYIIGRH